MRDDDLARVARAELLLDYIGKKVREQLSVQEAEDAQLRKDLKGFRESLRGE